MSALNWSPEAWIGSAEQCEAIRQFARDFDWEGDLPIESPQAVADGAIEALTEADPMHPDAEARLRAALIESAEAAEVES